jgi:HK97 family phage prohead protease
MTIDMRPVWMRAAWPTAYVNDLPDSAFLVITPGGMKAGGKTDGAHRFFPVYGQDGQLDDAHLQNALARIPQASTLTADQRAAAMTKAKALARQHPTMTGPSGTYGGSAGSGRSTPAGVLDVRSWPVADDDLPSDALGPQQRTFELIMELRSAGDGRTLYGRAVPYGIIADIGRYKERFRPGVFSRQVASNQIGQVKMYASHADRIAGHHPIGRTLSLAEQADGLYGMWPLFDTSAAEDSLKLVRAGEVTGLSVGFSAKRSGSQRADDGVIDRVAAHLDHVVLTHEPVYSDAQVLSVRSKMPEYEADRERLRALVR